VATYHQLADRLSRALGQVPDFSQPGVFDRLEAFMDGYAPSAADRFDEIIIDEGRISGRDGPTICCASCAPMVAPGGWKTLQNLYGRPETALPGWVTLRSDTNYRSPRDILATLRLLLPLAEPVMAGSP
jgi:hypothetical protein